MRALPCRILIVLALLVPACVPPATDSEPEARRQLDVARALEASRNLKEAAHEYAMVAERYPKASTAPIAARRAALLYASADNPGRSDSLSLHWWRRSLALPAAPEEKEEALLVIALLTSVDSLQARLSRETAVADSLFAHSKKQSNSLAALEKRLQELEAELQRTASELRKLKEIDVKLSKQRNR